MRLADLSAKLRGCLGVSAPDASLLRTWTEENILAPKGGGSSGKHRLYPEGEFAWALMAALIYEYGLRGASLKAAMIALRSWNDNQEPQPITDSGFHQLIQKSTSKIDQIAILRIRTDKDQFAYRILEFPDKMDRLQKPYLRLSLAWIAGLLEPDSPERIAAGRTPLPLW